MRAYGLCRIFFCLIILFAAILPIMFCKSQKNGSTLRDFEEERERTLILKDDWYIQSSSLCKDKGKIISLPEYKAVGWQKTFIPSTVLGALVRNGVYKDIYPDKNLEKIPREQFLVPWWFRKEMRLSDDRSGFSIARLILEGINYRANIWFNGNRIATTDEVTGSFRIFDFDITSFINSGKNVLALEVFPPQPGDFSIGFVDWNPEPPDRNMGVWRPVKIHFSGPVSLAHPYVRTKVNLETLKEASLTVSTGLTNHTSNLISGVVKGEIDNIRFSQPFSLDRFEEKEISFSPVDYRQLHIDNPRLWWPHHLDKPNLYRLKIEVIVEGVEDESDSCEINFGIREVADYINAEGYRGYLVNGKKILIRGGGWVDDMLLSDNPVRVEDQFKYIKHMNLNSVRLEGFWGNGQHLYDMADKYGILLLPGWSCQWEWQNLIGKAVDEFGAVKSQEDIDLIVRSLRDQVLWLRHHPSILVWILGSDKLPRPRLEEKYNELLDRIDPSRPRLSACKLLFSKISGSTAVKMNGPYDYVPPVYWYINKKNGGAFGFNTESGPGPQPPPLESLKRMFRGDRLWPINATWDYHCAGKRFSSLDRYMLALNKRYGEPADIEEFSKIAQVANYEAMRAMFEAFTVNKPRSTGIIQWMLNSAWPSLFWQLYDYFLMPNGAFYGAKKANRPLNVIYNYGDKSIYIVNETFSAYDNLNIQIRVFNFNSQEVFSEALSAEVGKYESKKIMAIPPIKGLTPVYFIALDLYKKDKSCRLDNFYWLSQKPDVLDDRKTTWYYTPQREFADFSSLQKLAKVKLEADYRFEYSGEAGLIYVTLRNPGGNIAFFVELKVIGERSRRSLLPIFWDDNYITLLPGESKTLYGRFPNPAFIGEKPEFVFSGLNVE